MNTNDEYKVTVMGKDIYKEPNENEIAIFKSSLLADKIKAIEIFSQRANIPDHIAHQILSMTINDRAIPKEELEKIRRAAEATEKTTVCRECMELERYGATGCEKHFQERWEKDPRNADLMIDDPQVNEMVRAANFSEGDAFSYGWRFGNKNGKITVEVSKEEGKI